MELSELLKGKGSDRKARAPPNPGFSSSRHRRLDFPKLFAGLVLAEHKREGFLHGWIRRGRPVVKIERGTTKTQTDRGRETRATVLVLISKTI